MVVIVTGGAGFIGSHLVENLATRDDIDRIIVIDSLVNGKLENINGISSKITFHKVDIRKEEELDACFNYKNITCVFHLAALADIVPSIDNPSSYYSTNVTGTYNVLEAVRKHNIPKFIYTASSSCYGLVKSVPTSESDPINCQYPYALTKYLGEKLALDWGKIYNFQVNSLRLFNVYGPRSRTNGTYGAVFGVFLAQKLKGKPFTVVGDGQQSRDFTFVSDIASAFIQLSKSELNGEILNVGSGGHYSINKLISLLGNNQVKFIPKRPGEPDITFADINKISKLLSWKPKVKFTDGVKIMLDHIENWQDAPLWSADDITKATKSWFKYLS